MSASLLKADMREFAPKYPLLRVRCKAVAFKPTRTFEIDWTIPGVTLALSACRRPLHRHPVESESLMHHRSDRPKLANRSHLTLRFTADVFPRFSSISFAAPR